MKKPSHNFVDLTGQVFGKLQVSEMAFKKRGKIFWKAKCIECGHHALQSTYQLKRRMHCPCRPTNFRHGDMNSPTYKSWNNMVNRCTQPAMPVFHHYGGRGIKVCDRWRDYRNFLADMGPRPPGTSIDRIDGNGDYEPSNCRWASRKEQRRNMAQNNRITHNGITLTLAEWADRTGISRETLRSRFVRQGWNAEETLTTPVQKRRT